MAAQLALYCSSSVGILDPLCMLTTPVPLAQGSSSKYHEYLEIFGYFLFVFSLFCFYFLVLFSYKIIKGYSLPYSFRFALCGAQRVLYNRTVRLGVSLFATPAPVAPVVPIPVYRACMPVRVSTPISEVVIEITPSTMSPIPSEIRTESTVGVIGED
jgi:hypothetical protein